MMTDVNSLIKIVTKDFELPEELSESQLLEAITASFAYLIEENFPKVIQILYKADVDQDKLRYALEHTENASSASVIANAYIARQKAKIETWKKYS